MSFRILDAKGRPVRDFEVEQDKRMHLIIVRRDTQGFQHLHPRMDDDGRWSTPVRLPRPAATASSPTSSATARRPRSAPT